MKKRYTFECVQLVGGTVSVLVDDGEDPRAKAMQALMNGEMAPEGKDNWDERDFKLSDRPVPDPEEDTPSYRFHCGHVLQIVSQSVQDGQCIELRCNTCGVTLEHFIIPAAQPVYYIASPLTAATRKEIEKNAALAADYQTRLQETLKAGYAYAPHAYLPRHLDDHDPISRAAALEYGREVLKHCSGLIVCGPTISAGMQAEIDLAKDLGMMIHRYNG